MTALLTQILQRPIAFHRIFAQIAGSAAGGLFDPNFSTGETRSVMRDGWIYKTYKEWQQETMLTRSEIDRFNYQTLQRAQTISTLRSYLEYGS